MTEIIKSLGGRPTKYNQEMQSIAEWYCDNYESAGDIVPTFVGLALAMDVATNTVYNWATDSNPQFLRVFTRIEQLQHKGLVNGGLSGNFNPAITKMMMTKHGYSDAQKVDHTTNGKDMSASGDAVLAALARKHADG